MAVQELDSDRIGRAVPLLDVPADIEYQVPGGVIDVVPVLFRKEPEGECQVMGWKYIPADEPGF